MLISRDPDGPRIEIDTPPQFIWHYASAAEDPVTGTFMWFPDQLLHASRHASYAGLGSLADRRRQHAVESSSKFREWMSGCTCCRLSAGRLTIDACVFDAFSPGGFNMQEPSTMSASTLRRCASSMCHKFLAPISVCIREAVQASSSFVCHDAGVLCYVNLVG